MAKKDKQSESYLKRLRKASEETLRLKQNERAVQQNISTILEQQAKTATGIGKSYNEKLQSQLEGLTHEKQLEVLAVKRNALLQSAVNGQKDVNQALISQLDELETYIGVEKERKDLAADIKSEIEGSKDELYGSLGAMGEMLKAGTSIGFAMAALKGTTEAFGAVFETTIGFASELNKELGISGKQAMALGMQNFSADVVFSRFSMEQLNTATKDFAQTMGTTAGISNDIRNSMAELSSMGLGGDDAAKLAQSFETANGSAQAMTAEIKQMANDAGVMASTTFKDLATQQNLMLGATEAEIKALAKKTIELNKQGVSLEQMKGISEGMMDIEGSMKAQAKARIMLQGKLTQDQLGGMQAMTAAALEYQRTGNMDVMTDALKKVKMSAAEFNDLGPRGQEVYAQSIGMTAASLGDVIRKQEQMAKVEDNYGAGAASMLETYQRIPQSIKDGVVALVSFAAQQMVISKLQTGSFGIGNLNPFKKKGGGGGGSPIETEMPGTEEVGQTQSGGGLKSLAEGLREMGDGKVFAGIGAVALAGPAFIIALPSIPFLLFMGKVKLKALEENLSGLAAGLNSMSTTFMGSLAMGAFGIAAIPSILSIPFLLFMGKVKLKALEENFSGLSTGLNSMSTTFMGSLALGAFGIAAIPSIASIPFLLFMGMVKLKSLSTNFLELGIGLQMMASTFMGSLALGAFAVAATLGIASIPFLIAIALLGGVAGTGLGLLGGGLAALGATAPMAIIGIGLIALLGLAMIPFAVALLLITPLIEAFGNIIIGVLSVVPPIIAAIAEGFVTMMSAISMENVGTLFLLGPALLSAAVGMVGFGAAMLFGAPAILGLLAIGGALALLAPNLETFGNVVVNVMGAIPQIIQSIAEGFVTMFTAITPENVLGMMMLGPALLSASVGMIAFSAALAVGGIASFFGGGVLDSIKELSTVGPGVTAAGEGLALVAANISVISASMQGLGSLVSPLYALAGGLMSISAGLTSIAFSGLLAMPVFAMLAGVAAIAPILESLGSMFGSDDSDATATEDGSMDKVVDAINKLSGEIASQPILLTIDGKSVQKISRIQSQQSSATRGAR